MHDYIQQVSTFDVHQGEPVRVEKMVAFYTSRDRAISDTLAQRREPLDDYPDFGEALAGHAAAWDELWEACDLRPTGDERVQLLLRLHTSHLLQVCSRHTADLDAGVPARGLNGEAYRGHVFWDELFVFPFLNLRLPRDHARAAHVPLPAASRGPRGRARGGGYRAPCTRGRAAATAEETQRCT